MLELFNCCVRCALLGGTFVLLAPLDEAFSLLVSKKCLCLMFPEVGKGWRFPMTSALCPCTLNIALFQGLKCFVLHGKSYCAVVKYIQF